MQKKITWHGTSFFFSPQFHHVLADAGWAGIPAELRAHAQEHDDPRVFYHVFTSPVAEERVELDDGLLLLERELAPLDVRPQVVGPPEPAALAAPPET
jgi:hypothetical protein